MRSPVSRGVLLVVTLLWGSTNPGPGQRGDRQPAIDAPRAVDVRARRGEKIAYHRYLGDAEGSQILRWWSGGGDEQQLTTGQPAASPRWAPGGTKIAYGHGRRELTMMDFAIDRCSGDMGRLLVENGAEISSIHGAALIGDLARIKAFLDDGANVNDRVVVRG